ncbi:DUF4249 domain-containing protein [Maribacter algarum]|uniref:DUF4249 domain-containing protein n=1 Tax=Maribacter algarum (ex Zhang et al. 2020) TaxID=2578118 RepID=A0A5S3PQM8_9FLAO|nr:DUF4249 family protein [Maribacter algarum]TMM55965.1 DUF4249 domain-containing protein [Maribacter algarum]
MKKYILFFAATLVIFTSCQKVVDANGLLDIEAKVFITGYISPQDTLLRVHVSRALPVFGTPLSVRDQEANQDKFLIKDAQVTISDEAGNSTNLSYSEEERTYFVDASTLAIVANQSYFLNVVADGDTYTASCTIPTKVAELNERINLRENSFGGQEVDINLAFQDAEEGRSFYVIGGFVSTTYQIENEEPVSFVFDLFFESDEFLSDNLEDGGTLDGSAFFNVGNDVNVIENRVTLQVAHVEEALFQNLKTASTNVDADGNPFVEYAIAPNNIQEEGAVGVFAGYQLTEKVVELDF